jgi:hypothetical protein
MAGKIYVAKSNALIKLGDGNSVVLKQGITRVREGHPLLNGHESMFEEIGVHYDVETTRQAPEPETKPEPVKAASEPGVEPTPEVKAEPKPSGLTSESAPRKTASTPRRGPRKT